MLRERFTQLSCLEFSYINSVEALSFNLHWFSELPFKILCFNTLAIKKEEDKYDQ